MSVTYVLFTVIIYPILQIFEFVFVFFQKVFKETGLSVLGISAAISLLTLPLYTVAEKWQQTERDIQRKLKPGIKKIKTAFSGDEQYMILSTYYRQNHYHPIYALRSSFGLLIQVPFFIAAYSFLTNLDSLKGTSFTFISDMSIPDSFLKIRNHYFNLLPFLMTIINIVASALYTKGFSLKEKLPLYLIALFFMILLYNAPAGLVIFWTMNNIFSLIKNIYNFSNFRKKHLIPSLLISIFFMFILYYILIIHNGSAEQRKVIALISIIFIFLPWIMLFIKNYTKDKTLEISENLSLFIFSITVLWLLIGLFIPSNLIVSSPDEFSYIDSYNNPVYYIANTALQALGLLFFWPLCLYLLFNKIIRFFFTITASVIFVSALINVFVFHGNYGLISTTLQFSGDVNHSKKEVLLNLLLLILLGTAFIILFFKIKKINIFIIPISIICTLALLILSCFNLINIQRSFRSLESIHRDPGSIINEVKPLFNLSKKGDNIVIIMLDRASSSFFPYILDEDPSLYDLYTGFTYYPNTVSFNGYTALGAPPVFGGYEYTPEEINKRDNDPLVKKHNESLLLLPELFVKSGYQVTVTDPPYPNYSVKDDFSIYDFLPDVNVYLTDSVYTDIWIKENNLLLPSASDILKRDILWYSLFRSVPPLLRWTIYQRGDWCSSVSGQKIRGLLNGYSVVDYLPRLTNISQEKFNTALIMVNNATHEGAFLQAPEYRPVLNVVSYSSGPFSKETEYHINIAAFKRLAEWFSFLKQEEVYDNTRIILVSDHGSQISYVTKLTPSMPDNFDNLHPILLVKDFNSHGKLITDDSFMSNADVPFLALSGQIDDPINPFTGKKVTIDAKDAPLYIAISGSIHRSGPTETQFYLDQTKDFYVHTNIFDPNNWEKAVK